MRVTLTVWCHRRVVDVLVAGAGPAGWALASACARLGLSTVVVAPRPSGTWRPTYGLWSDEAGVLPVGARYVTARPRGMSRGYVVLDNPSVQSALRHAGVRTVVGRVRSLVPGGVRLATGEALTAAVVINATGTPRNALKATFRAEQSAFGVLVPAVVAAPVVGPGEAVFMDWRGDTFLYAVPVADGRVLLEETSLARQPGLGMRELRQRLFARLASHGIVPSTAEVWPPAPGINSTGGGRQFSGRWDVERVRFAVDTPAPAPFGRGAIPFGAAAGFVHPATGFSVADTFRLAPRVAATIARTVGRGPVAVNVAARHAMWSPAARAVHRLRRRGLATLLALRPEQVPEFFDLFFALPPHRQRAYLSGREDIAGTAAAMAALYRSAPRSLRRVMVGLRQTGESVGTSVNSG
jgi:lycopene beta-cyclase